MHVDGGMSRAVLGLSWRNLIVDARVISSAVLFFLCFFMGVLFQAFSFFSVSDLISFKLLLRLEDGMYLQ